MRVPWCINLDCKTCQEVWVEWAKARNYKKEENMTTNMNITEKQFMDSFHLTLSKMEEGVDYLVSQDYWDQMNNERKNNGYGILKREEYPIRIQNKKIFVANREVITIDKCVNINAFAFALAFAFTFAFAFAFAFAISFNKIEKVNKEVSCEGKIVEIDGKKYKLQSV